MKRLTKKVLATALTTVFAFAAFAEEGISFNGYIRAGLEGNLDKETVDTTTFHDGYYYGHASSRLRLNLDIDKGQYGVNLRYQANKFGYTAFDNDGKPLVENPFFNGANIRYAVGYAKLFDDKFIIVSGKLKDKYTSADGYDSYNLAENSGKTDVFGATFTFVPVNNLFLTAQLSTLNADTYATGDSKVTSGKAAVGQIKFNEKILAFSAKYIDDVITVAGGYSLSGQGYGFFKYKDIENIVLEAEAKYLSKDISDKKDKDGKKTFSLKVSEKVAFQKDELEVGVLAYETLIKDKNEYEIYPFASYKVTDVVSVVLEAGIKTFEEDNKDTTYSVTPSVVFNVGKANVRAFFNYDKDAKASIGTTTKVSF